MRRAAKVTHLRVTNFVTLVQHSVAPAMREERAAQLAQAVVRRDARDSRSKAECVRYKHVPRVRTTRGGRIERARDAMEDNSAQHRRPAVQLSIPVRKDRRRGDDED